MPQCKNLPILFGLFAASVVMTNAVSANLIKVGPFVMVAGALLYPVTFLLTDVLSEVYGKRIATRAVWTGFAAQALAVVFVQFAALWPSLNPEMGQAWSQVFQPMWRLALGSMIAYLVAQLIDVRVFHYVKRKTNGKHLWFRNNVSTLVSQAVDTVVFALVAFAGVLSWDNIVSLILGQYTAKALMAALDTPLCYLAVSYFRSTKLVGDFE